MSTTSTSSSSASPVSPRHSAGALRDTPPPAGSGKASASAGGLAARTGGSESGMITHWILLHKCPSIMRSNTRLSFDYPVVQSFLDIQARKKDLKSKISKCSTPDEYSLGNSLKFKQIDLTSRDINSRYRYFFSRNRGHYLTLKYLCFTKSKAVLPSRKQKKKCYIRY